MFEEAIAPLSETGLQWNDKNKAAIDLYTQTGSILFLWLVLIPWIDLCSRLKFDLRLLVCDYSHTYVSNERRSLYVANLKSRHNVNETITVILCDAKHTSGGMGGGGRRTTTNYKTNMRLAIPPGPTVHWLFRSHNLPSKFSAIARCACSSWLRITEICSSLCDRTTALISHWD